MDSGGEVGGVGRFVSRGWIVEPASRTIGFVGVTRRDGGQMSGRKAESSKAQPGVDSVDIHVE
jgi:hypothetical protein